MSRWGKGLAERLTEAGSYSARQPGMALALSAWAMKGGHIKMSDHGSILVVDDEAHVSEMLQEYFLELGYSVDVAATGDEAFRRAVSKRPDAVILDMRLPDTTGEQLLTRLRTLDGSLQIVMLSGHVDEDIARRTVAAGAVECLHKPFDFDVLQRTITQAVEAGRDRPADAECVAR